MCTLHANQQELDRKVKKLEEKVDTKAEKADVEEIKERVNTLEGKVNTKLNADPENPTPSTSTGQGKAEDIIKELKAQEERKNDIILFNVPESKANDMNERTKHDKEEVKEITKICNATIKKDEMIRAIRLGKKPNADKPRPLLIEIINDDKKKALFKNLSKLQNAPEKYRSVSIQNDLTQKQREREKMMREEAKKKEQEASGEGKFKVRGPPWDRKIVKVEAKK